MKPCNLERRTHECNAMFSYVRRSPASGPALKCHRMHVINAVMSSAGQAKYVPNAWSWTMQTFWLRSPRHSWPDLVGLIWAFSTFTCNSLRHHCSAHRVPWVQTSCVHLAQLPEAQAALPRHLNMQLVAHLLLPQVRLHGPGMVCFTAQH